MSNEEIENALKCLEMDMLDNTRIELLLNYIDKLQKENEELKEKIENEIKELEESEDFYREHDRMYEYEGKINLLKRILAKE